MAIDCARAVAVLDGMLCIQNHLVLWSQLSPHRVGVHSKRIEQTDMKEVGIIMRAFMHNGELAFPEKQDAEPTAWILQEIAAQFLECHA